MLGKLKRYVREAYWMGHYPSLGGLFSRKPLIAYYGFLGDGNLGDEMVWWAAQRLFSEFTLIPIKRRMPLRFIAWQRSNHIAPFAGVVFGGGTLLGQKFHMSQYLSSIMEKKGRVFLHGTGIRADFSPSAWAPLFQHTIYGGVRGRISQQRIEHVKPLAVCGDAALFLRPEGRCDRTLDSNKILFNFGTHVPYEGQTDARPATLRFLRDLHRSGYKLCFVPFHKIDLAVAETIRKEVDFELVEKPRNFEGLQALFEDCAFAVGERLHFIVSAVLFRRRFMSVNYSDKHEDFLSSIGLSHRGVAPDAVTPAVLSEAFESEQSVYGEGCEGRIEALIARQREDALAFVGKQGID